jgi:hypothetical protein
MQNPPENIINLTAERFSRTKNDPQYETKIARMNKYELLEEMVRFQEERSEKGRLSLEMMVRGQILFRALENTAETSELRLLASSYRRHLEHEIESLSKNAAAH